MLACPELAEWVRRFCASRSKSFQHPRERLGYNKVLHESYLYMDSQIFSSLPRSTWFQLSAFRK